MAEEFKEVSSVEEIVLWIVGTFGYGQELLDKLALK